MKKLIIFTLFIGLLGACSSSNNTTSKVDYEKLKSDIGLIGEIINTIENECNFEEVFLEVI